MSNSPINLKERFATLVQEFLSNPDVTPPSGNGFGSGGLRIHGQIFAMLSSQGEFVVKLPLPRVNALIASDAGHRFETGHGRFMKEWLAVDPTYAEDWSLLAQEALEFVAQRA